MSSISIVTVRQDATDHNFRVHDADPEQMAVDLRAPVDGLAEEGGIDMGDLAASYCASMRWDYGSGVLRMLPAAHPLALYDQQTRWHYVVTRPMRSLQIEIKRIVKEDKKRVPIDVWSGTMANFERQVKTIVRNMK